MIRLLAALALVVSAAFAQVPVVVPTLEPTLESTLEPSEEAAAAAPSYGLSFDGGDQATTSTAHADFQIGTNDVSLSFWFKPEAGSYQAMFANDATGNDPLIIMFNTSNIWGTVAFAAANHEFAVSPVTPGVWTHALITLDRDANVIAYANGVAGGAVDISAHAAVDMVSTSATMLGTNKYFQTFTGILVDLRWWLGTVLTPEQVATEAANTSPYSYPTVEPTWHGLATNDNTATQVTPLIGSAVFPFGAGAAAPTWVGPDAAIPPTEF